MKVGNRAAKALLVGGAVAVLLAGCGFDSNSKQAQTWNDAPTKGQPDENPAHVIAMPDGFNNIAIKCFPGTHSGVATLFHGNASYGGVVVFQNAEVCP